MSWVEFRRVRGRMLAEMWRDLFEGEGLPCHLLPEGDIRDGEEEGVFRVLVPRGREHVAEEILRKI